MGGYPNNQKHRMIDDVLERLGLPPATHTTRGSGHICAEFVCLDGVKRKIFYSFTNHGGRGMENILAMVKRAAKGNNGQSTNHHQGQRADRVQPGSGRPDQKHGGAGRHR